MMFLIDECVAGPIRKWLEASGLIVVRVSLTASGLNDEDIIDRAVENCQILITQDRDFGELVVARGLMVSGVILLELERLTLSAQVQRFADCFEAGKDEFKGKFTVIEPGRIRSRPIISV